MNKYKLFEDIIGDWGKELSDWTQGELEQAMFAVDALREHTVIYPEKGSIFRAFTEVPPSKCKVIILGSNPYVGTHRGIPNATGLAYVTENGYHSASMLKLRLGIRRAANQKFGYRYQIRYDQVTHNLSNKGIMMLNSTLTVEHMQVKEHRLVWQDFMKGFIGDITKNHPDIIWVTTNPISKQLFKHASWGESSQYSENSNVIAGSIGSSIRGDMFIDINRRLNTKGKQPIDFSVIL